MTEEKDKFDKSAKPDSTEPEEPIDISGLMNSDDEDEDDGIIELKDEITSPSEKEMTSPPEEEIAPPSEKEVMPPSEDNDEIIELKSEVLTI